MLLFGMGECTEERWLSVVGYEGYYEVSDLGRVKRVAAATGAVVGRVLGAIKPCGGYVFVNLSVRNNRRRMAVHRLVLEAFVGPCPEGMETRHFPDRTPSNNRLENLQWGTRVEQGSDRRAHGTALLGEANPQAALRAVDVLEIRGLLAWTALSHSEIAMLFCVSAATVSGINRGNSWAHVPLAADMTLPIRESCALRPFHTHGAVLSVTDVLDVRSLLRNTNLPAKDIAALFSVSSASVSNINLGKKWRHVPDAALLPNANTYPCRPKWSRL